MKKLCCICKRELGLFENKIRIDDDIICKRCMAEMEKVGMYDIIEKLQTLKLPTIKSAFDKKKELASIFEADFQLGNVLIIDKLHKMFVLEGALFEFKNLKKVDIDIKYSQSTVTDTTTKTKKGVGKSLLGGMLFGATGAVAGAIATGGKTKSTSETTTTTECSSAKICLTLKDYYISKYFVELIDMNLDLKMLGCGSIEEVTEIVNEELKKIIEEENKVAESSSENRVKELNMKTEGEGV